MQTKKGTQHSRRLQTIAKLYSPTPKPVFNVVAKAHLTRETEFVATMGYAQIVRKELVKSLGLTFFFIVLQYILYFAYFRYL